ncbi:unnamed protein product, partial [Mesorhabditis belari]|uniref:Serine aminopeptidase S33 domain-containing protein n=1 Tax=Mesorhabditis belari TaxID=2138241 RepID=A0AAF3J500_9BILA
MQEWPTVENDQNLFDGKISFPTRSGYHVTIRAVWQDNLPSGSKVGTVFAIHGSPGSHNDFKYITYHLKNTGIRMISINMPGHGYTQNHKKISFHNDDRNAFIQAMIDHLNVDRDVVFVGHSRGSENALNICTLNQNRAKGLLLINTSGFRRHKGIKPFFIIRFASWIYNLKPLAPLARIIMHPILYHIYNRLVKLKTQSGKIAAVCVQSMKTFALSDQRSYVKELNTQSKFPILLAYSGKDFLIEEEIVREMLTEFEDSEELIIDDSQATDTETKAARWFRCRLSQKRTLGVCFHQDGHYLQKYKAKFLSDAIQAIFEYKD